MREPVGTRASNSPLGMSATTTSSDWSSVKSLMIGSPDSGKTTGCMVGLTSRCQGASQLPAVEMPASPPLIESQVTGPRVRDRLQGEPIFRPLLEAQTAQCCPAHGCYCWRRDCRRIKPRRQRVRFQERTAKTPVPDWTSRIATTLLTGRYLAPRLNEYQLKFAQEVESCTRVPASSQMRQIPVLRKSRC
jgi:hypothetical protein